MSDNPDSINSEMRVMMTTLVRESIAEARAELCAPRKWFTPKSAAVYIDLKNPITLQQWRTKGIGPKFHGKGKNIRYSRSDLDDYVVALGRK